MGAMRQRLLGLAMLVIGGVLAYFCIYSPMEAAARQAPSVSLSLKGAILCPLMLVMGLIYLPVGEHVVAFFGTRQAPKPAAWVLGILLLVAGGILYWWLRTSLTAAGYQFNSW